MQKITDDWIVGFVDGDGSFKDSFVVSQNERSVSVLYALKNRFNCGSVNKAGGKMREYRVRKKEDLKKHILPFFYKNPPQTLKWQDFKSLYEDVYGIPLDKEKGPIQISPDWLVGFSDAEGCFYTSMVKNYPRPQFLLGLHPRDQEILKAIQSFLKMGTVYARSSDSASLHPCVVYQISSIQNLILLMKIFMTQTNRCLLRTTKRISFLKFKQILRLIEQKQHLTEEGIRKIKKILSALRAVR